MYPKYFLKFLVKCDWSLNPTSKLASLMVFPFLIRLFALFNLSFIIKECGVNPISFLKTLKKWYLLRLQFKAKVSRLIFSSIQSFISSNDFFTISLLSKEWYSRCF